MIVIPLDQSHFSKYLYAFQYILNVIIYKKNITIDKVLHSILYIRDKISEFNPDESVPVQKILKDLLVESFNFYVEK